MLNPFVRLHVSLNSGQRQDTTSGHLAIRFLIEILCLSPWLGYFFVPNDSSLYCALTGFGILSVRWLWFAYRDSNLDLNEVIQEIFEVQSGCCLYVLFLSLLSGEWSLNLAYVSGVILGLVLVPRLGRNHHFRKMPLMKVATWKVIYFLAIGCFVFVSWSTFRTVDAETSIFLFEVRNGSFELACCTVLAMLALLVQYGRLELMFLASISLALITSLSMVIGAPIQIWVGCVLFMILAQWKPMIRAYRCGKTPSVITSPTPWPWLILCSCLLSQINSESSKDYLIMTLCLGLIWSINEKLLRYLLSLLTMDFNKRGFGPMTILDLIVSVCTMSCFVLATFLLSSALSCCPEWLIPPIKRKRYLHQCVCWMSRFILSIQVSMKYHDEGLEYLDFSQPRLLLCNHQSHIDLVMLLRLDHRLIVVTNDWVWDNPFYGKMVRDMDYIPAHLGIENNLEKIREKIKAGYSVLIFPEGTRTKNGSIGRYRQGAFQLAKSLNLPIQNLLLHGPYHCLPKKEFYMHPGALSLKVLPLEARWSHIEPDTNGSFGPLAKEMTAEMRAVETEWKREREHARYFSQTILRHYLYKGPVLEWYLKVKMALEDHYALYHDLLPKEGHIVDMGCGYGLMAQVLKQRSVKRDLLGVDLDHEKIAVAAGVNISGAPIKFEVRDLNQWFPPVAKAYVFNDVLHYLTSDRQKTTLIHCFENLQPNGVILIRDADADLKDKTKGTRWTEWWSTKLLGFNRHDVELSYLSGSQLETWCHEFGFVMERANLGTYTSNTLFVMKRVSQGDSP